MFVYTHPMVSHKSKLELEIKDLITLESTSSRQVYKDYIKRFKQGNFSREEDPLTHMGTFLVPFDLQLKKIFVTAHKKSGLWIPAGGHVDRDETYKQTAIRESNEELGLVLDQIDDPFFFSIVDINDPKRVCRRHYDAWFVMPTNPKDLKVDMLEFNDAKWVSFEEARQLSTHPVVLEAYRRIEEKYG